MFAGMLVVMLVIHCMCAATIYGASDAVPLKPSVRGIHRLISVDRPIHSSTHPFIDPSIKPVIIRPFFARRFRFILPSRDVLTMELVVMRYDTLIVLQTFHRRNRNHHSHPALVEYDVGERRPLELIRGLIWGQ
jgi:hypothetical protein